VTCLLWLAIGVVVGFVACLFLVTWLPVVSPEWAWRKGEELGRRETKWIVAQAIRRDENWPVLLDSEGRKLLANSVEALDTTVPSPNRSGGSR